MGPFATAIAVIAGVCLGVGGVFLFVALRRPKDRTQNLLFATFSLAYGGAVLSARASFVAQNPTDYFNAGRLSLVFAAIGLIALLWFVALYTGVGSHVVLWVFSAIFSVAAFVAAFVPELLFDYSAPVTSVTLPWGETLLMGQDSDPPLQTMWAVGALGLLVYVVVADVRLFRRGERQEALVLGFGLAWFAIAALEEAVVILGDFAFVVLADFGFLGFVISIGLAIANDAVESEAELRVLQTNLEETVQERTASLEAAQVELVARAEAEAATSERSRLARELHDVVTQLLFSINLIAGSLGRLWRTDPDAAARTTSELQRLTRGALAEMRVLLRELRPQAIVETDLATLIAQLADGLSARHDIPVEIQAELHGNLPEDVHVALYRIAQEAMNNVAKHAEASRLVVDLRGNDDEARLLVVDDGHGFRVDGIPAGTMGLAIMRERAVGTGAILEIVSAPNAGTSVEVKWNVSDRVGVG